MAEYGNIWDERPTKKFLEGIANRAGGTMDRVPYSAYQYSQFVEGAPVATTSTILVNGSAGYWGPFYARVAGEMKYLRLEFADEVIGSPRVQFLPENWIVDVPSTGADKITQAISQVFVGDPSIEAESPGGKPDDDAIITRFLNNLSQWEERANDLSPLNLIKNNCIPLGLSIRTLHVDMDWVDHWSDEPDQHTGESEEDYKDRLEVWNSERRASSPIYGGSEQPLNVCYDRANTPPQWFMIRRPIDPWDAKEQYPDWVPGQRLTEPMPNNQWSCLMRYWTNRYTACFIDGEPAIGDDGIAENPYGFIPCWPAAGGRGAQDPRGRPDYELRGVMAGRLSLLKQDALDDNLEQIYLQRVTYGPKDAVWGVEDPKVQADVEESMTNGPQNIAFMPGGSRIEHLMPAPIPDWLVARRERQDRRIDLAFGYNVQSGEKGGAEAASRTRIRLAQSNKGYDDAILHMQQAEEGYYMGVLRVLKHVIKRPIDVNMAEPGEAASWKRLTPEMIKDNTKVTVKLTGKSEEDKARELEEDNQKLQLGMIDRTQWLRNRLDADPQGTLTAIDADQIYQNVYLPKLLQIADMGAAPIVAQAAQEAGILFTPDELKQVMTGVIQQNLTAQAQQEGGQGAGGPNAGGSGGGGGAPPPGGSPRGVNGAGTALPGTSMQNAESRYSDNPQVSRPGSAEGMAQQRRLTQRLPVPVRG